MHPDKRKNKKMLMEFFVKNFMYTDGLGNPNHFKNFIKEVSYVKDGFDEVQSIFVEDFIHRLNGFKSVNLFNYYRA
jgi:hypothetical protein